MFLFLMLAVKNSTKRRLASSPASAITTGRGLCFYVFLLPPIKLVLWVSGESRKCASAGVSCSPIVSFVILETPAGARSIKISQARTLLPLYIAGYNAASYRLTGPTAHRPLLTNVNRPSS